MTKVDLIELLNQIDAKSEYSKLMIVYQCEANHCFRYDFYYQNKYIGYILSDRSLVIDALKELGDIDPRVISRIYLNCNYIDLNELECLHSIEYSYIRD